MKCFNLEQMLADDWIDAGEVVIICSGGAEKCMFWWKSDWEGGGLRQS